LKQAVARKEGGEGKDQAAKKLEILEETQNSSDPSSVIGKGRKHSDERIKRRGGVEWGHPMGEKRRGIEKKGKKRIILPRQERNHTGKALQSVIVK